MQLLYYYYLYLSFINKLRSWWFSETGENKQQQKEAKKIISLF